MQNFDERDVDDNGGSNPIAMIRSAGKLAAEDFWGVALTFAFLTIPPIWAGTYLPEDGANMIFAFLGLAAIVPQVLLTERALYRHNLVEQTHSKLGSYAVGAFGLSLIAGLGIIVGLFALLIPGLVLLARWSVSLPALVARDEGVTSSLQISWDLTEGRFWLCFLSVILAWMPAIIGIGVIVLGYDLFSIFVGNVLVESVISISMLLSWFVAVALYKEIVSRKVDLTG